MVLLMMVEAVGCYADYLVEAHDAMARYADCVQAAAGTAGIRECSWALLAEVGEALGQYFGCFGL